MSRKGYVLTSWALDPLGLARRYPHAPRSSTTPPHSPSENPAMTLLVLALTIRASFTSRGYPRI